MSNFIKKFAAIGIDDVAQVGGKNASLGEMFSKLSVKGIPVPDGFATTADAFWMFLNENNLKDKLHQLLNTLDRKKYSNLKEIGARARSMILDANV